MSLSAPQLIDCMKVKNQESNKTLNKTLIFLMIFGLLLRIINLNQSLWLDEAAQALESAGPLAGLFKIYADFMPPLFHILLHFWMKISHTETWMRLLSVGFAVGTIYYTYRIARHLFDWKVSSLSALLLAISPFHIFYSQELRPYSMATFFACLATYYLLKFNFWLYTLTSILLIYSIYTTPFLLLAHGIYLLLFAKRKFKQWMTAMVIVASSFIPWLPVFWRQFTGGIDLARSFSGWSTAVSVPPLKALPLILAKFMLGRITIDNKIVYGAVLLLIAGGVFFICWRSQQKKKKTTFILLLFILFPILSLFLLSFFVPLIAPQRLLYTLPLFLVILSSGIAQIKGRLKFIALMVVIIPNIFGLMLYYTKARFQREQWRQATAFVERNADEKTLVLFAFPEPFAPFLWYRRNENLGYGVVNNFLTDEEDLMRLSPLLENKEKIFYFQYLSPLTDREGKIPVYLNSHGFVLGKIYNFEGVGFIYQYKRDKFLSLVPKRS